MSMALAIADQRVFSAENINDLISRFPRAKLLLNNERDLMLAKDDATTLMSFLCQFLPTPLVNQLHHFGNHSAAWYHGLEVLAEPIKPTEERKDFTSHKERASIASTQNIQQNVSQKGRKMSEVTAIEKKKIERKHLERASKIKKLTADNPRRAGTSGHKSWSLMKEDMTVADFIAAGGKLADLKWDIKKGFVKLA